MTLQRMSACQEPELHPAAGHASHGRIDMGHGSRRPRGHGAVDRSRLFLERLRQPLRCASAQRRRGRADIPAGHQLVVATDGHVVSPLFFPGGDVGCLSVHGTLNDVAMCGARPLHLAASFIIEEGFALADLKRIVQSMADAARAAGVSIVTGDTKVVERGKGDGVFICTTGIGVVAHGVQVGGANARPGDVVLLSGTIGEHGVAVLSAA
jgi:hydrogenase expression/formation protein HypE